ncbi:peptidoglycan DD-metalloendopeptidase family protein [bacterium]|nr:peptidoglycan DD-metalloendopeptidase family protein [bacterium]
MTYLFTNPQVKKWKTLFVLSFCLNLILIALIVYTLNDSKEKDDTEAAATAQTETNSAETGEQQATAAVQEGAQPAEPEKPEKELNIKTDPGELIAASAVIEDNFYNAFNSNDDLKQIAKALGMPNLADIISAHVGRLLIWDIVLRNDVRKGDKIDFVFRVIPDEEKRTRNDLPDVLEIMAVKYFSHKFNKEINIYKYAAKNSVAKYYYSDGIMLEKIISPFAPVKNYIQITSTIGDRAPKHEGVDFKTNVGTPVYATVNGTVSRINWKTRYNGYCIEIEAKGSPYVFKYLHLSEVNVEPGQKVTPGQQIAASGNTGKSTAPHLHYQINVGNKGKVVDPMKYHKTIIEKLPENERENFKNRISELDDLMKQ